ncbi:MAG: choice-of-anchor Q domain-containing protein [Planctomycetota bacterium]|jgi:hypothetical protein
MKEKVTIYAMLFVAFVMVSIASGETIYVDDDGLADFNNIQAAIDAAYDNDTIIVSDGVYTGDGNRDIDFLGKAIVLRSANGPQNCIIDCNGTEAEPHIGFYFHNEEDANSILDGFTITNGFNEYYYNGFIYHYGGVIDCYKASPTITNCIIKDNIGIGIYCYEGNSSNVGTRTFRVFNCTISNNSRGGLKSAIYGYVEIDNCVINMNCSYRGGGIFCVCGNKGNGCNVVISNSIVTNNVAESGSGMYLGGLLSVKIKNCTISDNYSELDYVILFELFSGYSANIENSIIHGNYPDSKIRFLRISDNFVSYCNIEGGIDSIQLDHRSTLNWKGNIDADPCFAQPGYWDVNGLWLEGDYHLLPDSPCIDAGDPNYVPELNETDLDDRLRVIGGRIDMGAYEYMPSIPAEARIIPRTINLASKGNRLTCYILLPEDYDVADIDPNSIFLEDEIQPEQLSVDEQKQVAIAKFSREWLRSIINAGEVELTITGQLKDGTIFETTDVIKVIDKGVGKPVN